MSLRDTGIEGQIKATLPFVVHTSSYGVWPLLSCGKELTARITKLLGFGRDWRERMPNSRLDLRNGGMTPALRSKLQLREPHGPAAARRCARHLSSLWCFLHKISFLCRCTKWSSHCVCYTKGNAAVASAWRDYWVSSWGWEGPW